MKDLIEKVNVTKVSALLKKIGEDLKKLNRIEREFFFNAIKKTDLLMDPELCDNMMGVAFKKKQPQFKQMITHLREQLKERFKDLREESDK